MSAQTEMGVRIGKLRKFRHMTPSEFAEALDTSPGRISEWERGVRPPSPQSLIKLAALAAEADAETAVFFLERTGLGAEKLVGVVSALLQSGNADPGRPLLQVAEAILKEQGADPRALQDAGEAVLVPPYSEGEWKVQKSLRPLCVPAELVRRRASTFYLREGSDGRRQRGFCNQDIIVFDTWCARTRLFSGVLNKVVLIWFSGPKDSEDEAAVGRGSSEGLFLGRIAMQHEIDASWFGLTRREASPIMERSEFILRLASFQLKDYLSGSRELLGTLSGPVADYRARISQVKSAEIKALGEVRMPAACRIMGEFIALFAGDASTRERQDIL